MNLVSPVVVRSDPNARKNDGLAVEDGDPATGGRLQGVDHRAVEVPGQVAGDVIMADDRISNQNLEAAVSLDSGLAGLDCQAGLKYICRIFCLEKWPLLLMTHSFSVICDLRTLLLEAG